MILKNNVCLKIKSKKISILITFSTTTPSTAQRLAKYLYIQAANFPQFCMSLLP
jgi:hypothetical protein